MTWGGSWSNADLAMTWSNANVSYYGFAGRVPSAAADREVVYDYRMGDTSSASYHCWTVLRDDYPTEDKQLILDTHRDRIDLVERVDGVLTVVGTSSTFSTTQGAWYTVRAVCNGSSVTVYRGERGGTLSQIMNATTSLASGVKFWFGAMKDFQFDNVVFPDSVTTTTTTLAYNNGNELTSMTTGGVATNFAYDAWGRQTSKTQGGYSASYAYDYGGKLRSVTSNFPNEGTVTYQYGGDGKRRERVAGGTTTRYKWDDDGRLLSETDANGNLAASYIYNYRQMVDSLMCVIDGSSPATGTSRYFFQDYVNSTRGVYSSNRSALGEFAYTPYGTMYSTSGTSERLLFTGHEWDATAQLYGAPYRFYSPTLQRWISPDPAGMLDGPNLRAYVVGNPINFLDPLGLGWQRGPCGAGEGVGEAVVPEYCNPFSKKFSPACQEHDNCYSGCGEYKSKTKPQCDRDFYKNMRSTCGGSYAGRQLCKACAWLYWRAVQIGGSKSFTKPDKRTGEPCACPNK